MPQEKFIEWKTPWYYTSIVTIFNIKNSTTYIYIHMHQNCPCEYHTPKIKIAASQGFQYAQGHETKFLEAAEDLIKKNLWKVTSELRKTVIYDDYFETNINNYIFLFTNTRFFFITWYISNITTNINKVTIFKKFFTF